MLIWPLLLCHNFPRFCLFCPLGFPFCWKNNMNLFLGLSKKKKMFFRDRFKYNIFLWGDIKKGQSLVIVNVWVRVCQGCVGKWEWGTSQLLVCNELSHGGSSVWNNLQLWSTWSNKVSDVSNEKLKGRVTMNNFWRMKVKYYGKYRGL